jgi:hypothetical protein
MIGLLVAVDARSDPSPGTAVLVVMGSVAPGVSLILVGLATVPRLAGPKGSLVFFGGIAGRTADRYAADVSAMSPSAYLVDLVAQTHRNAQIAVTKFRFLGWATVLLVLGIVPWLAAVFWILGG